MVADLARLEWRPPETLVVPGEGRGDEHSAHPLESHALTVVVLGLRSPAEEGRHVFGHLFTPKHEWGVGGAKELFWHQFNHSKVPPGEKKKVGEGMGAGEVSRYDDATRESEVEWTGEGKAKGGHRLLLSPSRQHDRRRRLGRTLIVSSK